MLIEELRTKGRMPIGCGMLVPALSALRRAAVGARPNCSGPHGVTLGPSWMHPGFLGSLLLVVVLVLLDAPGWAGGDTRSVKNSRLPFCGQPWGTRMTK